MDLTLPEYVIGREVTSPLPLPSAKVSRRHARLFRKNEQWFIEDLNSQNGVYIDGQRIADAARISTDSDIEICSFTLRLHDPDTYRVVLLGQSGDLAGKRFALGVGEHDVGRFDDVAIALGDASVSRRHATITVDATTVAVTDHKSSNGTFVGDEQVEHATLHDGDRVRFGNVELELYLPKSKRNRFGLSEKHLALGGALAALVIVLATVFVAFLDDDPSQALETRYMQGVLEDVGRARELAATQSFHEAAKVFSSVLERDPINREARAGLAMLRAKTNQAPTPSAANREALAARYASEDLRQVVVRYAAGDLLSALRSVRMLAETQEATLLAERLSAIETGKGQVKALLAQDRTSDARDACKRLLALDAEIVPASYPSALREDLTRELTRLDMASSASP